MSEERLQEIKDSVEFQKEILKAHNMDTLCVDEEQELVEEIERLNNIINKVIYFVESMEYCGQEDYFYDLKAKDKCGNDNTFNDSKYKLLKILKGEDKE